MLRARGVGPDDIEPTIVYLASLRVLRDLTLQGWVAGSDDDGVYVVPPSFDIPGEDPAEAKSDLRSSFRFVLADQLRTPSVETFVRRMEARGIGSLFADGPELAARLEQAQCDGNPEQAMQPVLELVDGVLGMRQPGCASKTFGGMPGCNGRFRTSRLRRNLHYLVRDERGPNRPIIGIAALGNAILGLNQRDDALGWSVVQCPAASTIPVQRINAAWLDIWWRSLVRRSTESTRATKVGWPYG